jgi:hypothetical protein
MSAAPLPFQKPAQYIVCWPGDEREQLKYDGHVIVVPAKDEVADESPSSPFRFKAARDARGNLIPGTILLHSQSGTTPDGGLKVTFHPEEFLKGLYSVNQSLFGRGLQVVTEPSEVADAMQKGRPMWEDRQVSAWEEEVSLERDRRKRYEDSGQPPPPPTSAASLRRAVEGLERYHRARQEETIPTERLFSALAVSRGALPEAPPPPKPVAPLPIPDVPQPVLAEEDSGEVQDAQDDLSADAKHLWALCKQHNVELTLNQKEGLLDGNPKTMERVLEKLTKAGVQFGEPAGDTGGV